MTFGPVTPPSSLSSEPADSSPGLPILPPAEFSALAAMWHQWCELIQRVSQEAAAAERARADAAEAKLAALAAVIPPEQFRSMADWFDTDDEFKESQFPGTWPPGTRGHEVQDDLRKFADLLDGKEAANG